MDTYRHMESHAAQITGAKVALRHQLHRKVSGEGEVWGGGPLKK